MEPNAGRIAALKTEQINPHTQEIDRVDTLRMVRLLNDENRGLADVLETQADQIAAAVDLIATRLRAGGRLFYIGAGTSGRLGVLDASECPPTFSVPPELVNGIIAGGDIAIRSAVENAEDDLLSAGEQLAQAGLRGGDVVCGVSASGRTPYVLGGLRAARAAGAATIAVSNNAQSEIGAAADVAIEAVTGPEAISGSTRLKAGTAQKMILNILSTASMVKLGKTYRNIMIDVKASNAKLKLRCVNLLRTLFPGRADEELEAALAAADNSVKLAAVILHTGEQPAQAAENLLAHHGFLREILENEEQA